jgi:S1-C subfamily serine protease
MGNSLKQIIRLVMFGFAYGLYFYTETMCLAQNPSKPIFEDYKKNISSTTPTTSNLSFLLASGGYRFSEAHKFNETQRNFVWLGAALKPSELAIKLGELTIKPLLNITPLTTPCDHAKLATVQIYGNKKNEWGSGVIFHKRENQNGLAKYYAITNEHVVRGSKKLNILTSDRIVHSGVVNTVIKFDRDDLAIVEFTPTSSNKYDNKYEIASIADYEISEDASILAVGFPARAGKNPEFQCLMGNVGLVMDVPRTFEGGYRVGYDSKIIPGMSGGGVFDRFGKLVAINGRPKNIFLFNPYTYKHSRKIPCRPIASAALKLSWGIPITTVTKKINQALEDNQVSDANRVGLLDDLVYESVSKSGRAIWRTDQESEDQTSFYELTQNPIQQYKQEAQRIKNLKYCQISSVD